MTMDRLRQILLFAGILCFVFSVLVSAVYPWAITDGRHREATVEEVAADVSPDFKALKDEYAAAFSAAFPGAADALTERELAALAAGDPKRAASEEAWRRAYAHAIRRGRDLYVAEACWHCHSQYVRPVANEDIRFGPVRSAAADNNALQRPVLWGTRRVGPDLTNEGGLRSNDWHVAHFADPTTTSPGSVMPRYSWFLRSGFQVRRRVAPEVIEREGFADDRSHPVRGIYATREEAEAAMAAMIASTPQALELEKKRLFVAEARGPNADGLSVIAYLQWLGTWSPPKTPER
jgi:cbb3-type cytochrome c oxidase subunit II